MIRATPAQTGATIIIIIRLLELGTFGDAWSTVSVSPGLGAIGRGN